MVLGEIRLGLGLQDVGIFVLQFFCKSLISVDWLFSARAFVQSAGHQWGAGLTPARAPMGRRSPL